MQSAVDGQWLNHSTAQLVLAGHATIDATNRDHAETVVFFNGRYFWKKGVAGVDTIFF